MKQAQAFTSQVSVAPISINGADATATAVDGAGLGALSFLVTFGSIGATAQACKIQECDTSGGSYADVSGAAITTTLSSANAAGKTFRITVNLGGSRKRYFKPVITAGAGATLVSCIALGFEASQTPNTVTEWGCVEHVIV